MNNEKYYIKHKYLNFDNEYNYLNYSLVTDNWFLDNNCETIGLQVTFYFDELPLWVHEMLHQGHMIMEVAE